MFKTLVGTAILILAVPATADAQILKIGPLGGVSVRVPFVSVDVSPFGGTRVRAPFTAVNTPDRTFIPGGYGYGYAPPAAGYAVPYRDFHSPYFRGYHRDYRYDHHPLPPTMGPPAMGPPLTGPLNGSLDDPLDGGYRDRYRAGYRDDYRDDHLGGSRDGWPVPEMSYRQPLQEIYRPPAPRYHIPSYAEVFPGAEQEVSDFDPEPIATGPTQLAERLRDAAARLQESLEVREEGDVWTEYLRCEAIQEMADTMLISRTLEEVSVPQARAMLANFEGVAANRSLAWVTRLNGFDDTRQTLTELVTVVDGEQPSWSGIINMDPLEIQAEGFVPPADSEELPPPAPDPQPVFRGEV